MAMSGSVATARGTRQTQRQQAEERRPPAEFVAILAVEVRA
jgi:hypothetical protein